MVEKPHRRELGIPTLFNFFHFHVHLSANYVGKINTIKDIIINCIISSSSTNDVCTQFSSQRYRSNRTILVNPV